MNNILDLSSSFDFNNNNVVKGEIKIDDVFELENNIEILVQDKIIEPTREIQTVTADEDYDQLGTVTVNPIPDEYIIPDGTLDVDANGDVDVTMFRMARVGVYTPPTLQDKEVMPTKEEQIIGYDENYDGLNEVKVNPIPSEYIIPNGTMTITENGNKDVTHYTNVDVSIHPNLQNKTIEITENGTQTITSNNEYDGLNSVTVNTNVVEDLAEELTDYETNLTTQETSIQDIMKALEGKAVGGSGSANTADKPNINVYVQDMEPEDKTGVWIKTTGDYNYIRHISPTLSTFNTEIDATLPSGNVYPGGIGVGNEIYSFGGRSHNTSTDTNQAFKYNIDTKEITQLRELPSDTSFPGIAYSDDYIYIVGGRTGSTNKKSSVYKYDISSDTYETLPDLPNAVEGPSVYIKGDYMYVIATELSYNILKYSLIDGTSEKLSIPVSTNRGGLYDNSVYLFDLTYSNKKYTITMYEHNLDTHANNQVATLSSSSYLYGNGFIDNGVLYYAKSYEPFGFIAINLLTKQLKEYTLSDITGSIHYALFAYAKGNFYVLGGFNDAGTLYNIYKTPINKTLNYTSDLVVFLRDSGFSNTYSTSLKTDDLTTTLSFWNVLYNKGEGPINDNIPTYYGNGTEWIKFKG